MSHSYLHSAALCLRSESSYRPMLAAAAGAVAAAALARTTSRHASAVSMPASSMDRAAAAILGHFTADAASTRIHWVYRQADALAVSRGEAKGAALEGGFAALAAENKAPWAEGMGVRVPPPQLDYSALRPEFLAVNANPFYDYAAGDLSPYGHEALLLTRSLVKEGGLKQEAYAADCAVALPAYAAAGGRLNGLSKAFLANYEAGLRPPACTDAENKEANSLVRVPPLVARFGASAQGLQSVEAAIRVHMSNDLAVACALAFAVLLERAIQTGDAPAALLAWAATSPDVPESTKPYLAEAAAAAAAGRDVREVGVSAGLSCGLPGSLIVALAIAATYPDDYVIANRANMVVGGDSASRAAVVGGLLAARAGGVPEEWLSRVSLRGELEESAAKLASARFA